MRSSRRIVRWIGLVVGLALVWGGVVATAPAQDPGGGRRTSRVAQKPKSGAKGKNKGKSSAKAKPAEPAPEPTEPPANSTPTEGKDDGKLKFSRDIAPIFAGNCTGCHNADQRRGEFDLSTFRGLMAGSQSGPVIVPGKPEQSVLVDMVVSRKMPRGGGNRRLSDEAIGKIQQWVKEGAVLDAGISPTATMDKIAPTPEQRRQAELAKLPAEERDKKLEQVAQERWKQAGIATPPATTPGRSFLLFSNLPKERAEGVLKLMEAQRTRLKGLLDSQEAQVLDGAEKTSLYVFNEGNAYAEFVRAVERRELEPGAEAHGRLGVESPYVAAVDPLAGREEPKPSGRRPGRGKSAENEEAFGPLRSLGGLLTEHLAAATVQSAGKAPRWMADGLGAYFASQVEPRSPYYQQLRRSAAEQLQLGWNTKAGEALGDQGTADTIRALGFSLFEWLGSEYRQQTPFFVRGLLQNGPEQLDAVVQGCFGQNINREQFLGSWGQWIAARYGTRRR